MAFLTVSRDEVKNNLSAQAVLNNLIKILREPQRVGFRKGLNKSLLTVNVFNEFHLWTGLRRAITVDEERVKTFLNRLAKAYYWIKNHHPVSENRRIHCIPLGLVNLCGPREDYLQRSAILQMLSDNIGGTHKSVVDEEVFHYYHKVIYEKHKNVDIFLFVLYNEPLGFVYII
jgi:hypothetical protein